jgi:hypothetical protein
MSGFLTCRLRVFALSKLTIAALENCAPADSQRTGSPLGSARTLSKLSNPDPDPAIERTACIRAGQMADIVVGKIARFPDGSQAVPIDQSEGTTVRDEFYSTVAGKSAAQMKAHWSRVVTLTS